MANTLRFAILNLYKAGVYKLPGLPKDRTQLVQAQALLKSVAEELKLPLMQIVRHAELTALTEGPVEELLDFVRSNAGSAIELVDSYILGLELAESQQMLPLEPVAVGSVFYDVAHKLSAGAKRYNVKLNLNMAPGCEPVMTSPAALRAALFSLGSAFMESLPAETRADERTITLASRRTAKGVAAGIYSPKAVINSEQLRKIDMSEGWMRQPLSHFSSTSSAGIFVAKAILESMSAQLRTARFCRQPGLAAVLPLSYQLELV